MNIKDLRIKSFDETTKEIVIEFDHGWFVGVLKEVEPEIIENYQDADLEK